MSDAQTSGMDQAPAGAREPAAIGDPREYCARQGFSAAGPRPVVPGRAQPGSEGAPGVVA
jgi:hypothetical protein